MVSWSWNHAKKLAPFELKVSKLLPAHHKKLTEKTPVSNGCLDKKLEIVDFGRLYCRKKWHKVCRVTIAIFQAKRTEFEANQSKTKRTEQSIRHTFWKFYVSLHDHLNHFANLEVYCCFVIANHLSNVYWIRSFYILNSKEGVHWCAICMIYKMVECDKLVPLSFPCFWRARALQPQVVNILLLTLVYY